LTSRKTGQGKKVRKLKLKKETIKDLDLGVKAGRVKGGQLIHTIDDCYTAYTYVVCSYCKCLATQTAPCRKVLI
jgi:hypothetical protein